MADDMRVDDLRWAPRLRHLVARRGLQFENSFSSYPLCCPARASFLTGQHAHNHGVYSHRRPYGYGSFDDSRTLATSFRRSGYRTGFIGKYLNRYGLDRSRVSGVPSHRYVPRGWGHWRAAVENNGRSGFRGGTYQYFNTAFNVDGRVDDSHRGQYQSKVIGDMSVGMAARFSRGRRPFFMYVNYVAPHGGLPRESDDPDRVRGPRGRFTELHSPARPGWVEGRFDGRIPRSAGLPRGGGPAEASLADKPAEYRSLPELTGAERRGLREVTRQRAEAVHVMDRHVGRLIRVLQRTGEWRDTVFVFTSDNGYYLGEHRIRQGKILPHEPSLRIPLLASGPGFRTGEKRYDPSSLVDLTATLLDFGRARPPRPPDGRSLRRTMLGGDRGWRSPVLYEAAGTSRRRRAPGFDDARTAIGVRTGRYSYVRHRVGGHELYDLVRDPLQNRNIFGRESSRPLRRDLNAAWRRLRNCREDRCRAPLPASLQTTPREQRRLTRHYWREVDRVYGL